MIEEYYNYHVVTPSDINEHLPILRKYATGADTVVELGVSGICSTWAFLAARPKRLVSYDLLPPSNWGGNLEIVELIAKNLDISFEFRLEDALKVDIPVCDVLFIDTWHVYDQLIAELHLHSNKVSKYIILHDTVSYRDINEPLTNINSYDKPLSGKQGLKVAIDEFLETNKNWSIEIEYIHNNGLTVLVKNANIL